MVIRNIFQKTDVFSCIKSKVQLTTVSLLISFSVSFSVFSLWIKDFKEVLSDIFVFKYSNKETPSLISATNSNLSCPINVKRKPFSTIVASSTAATGQSDKSA